MNPVLKAGRLGARLLKIAVTNPARLSHIFGVAMYASDDVVDRAHDLLRLRPAAVTDLLPPEGPPLRIELALFPPTNASISVL